eukprot:gene5779-6018_t
MLGMLTGDLPGHDLAGSRGTRRTKLVCTIGPASCSYEVLSLLAQNGMNVARLNMTHGNHAWHNQVVERIRKLNKEKGGYGGCGGCLDLLQVGDHIVVDGGMCELVVTAKAGPDVLAESIEQGLLLSKANLTFRRLPAPVDISTSAGGQDEQSSPTIELIAKLEAYDCLQHMDEIVQAADGIMVARGDLGAQIPVEEVPSIQKYAVMRARQLGKPAIVAHQLLHSMIEYPIPTRAEVADVADVVRQRADALMLSGESAMGAYPEKALGVLRSVAIRMEQWVREEDCGQVALPQIGKTSDGRVSEEICASAALMANKLEAAGIFVFTRRGFMAHFLSRCRPDCPVFAFTDDQDVRRRLNLRWGVLPFWTLFCTDPEENVRRTFLLMKERGLVKAGDLVVVVSDLRPKEEDIIRSVQCRTALFFSIMTVAERYMRVQQWLSTAAAEASAKCVLYQAEALVAL